MNVRHICLLSSLTALTILLQHSASAKRLPCRKAPPMTRRVCKCSPADRCTRHLLKPSLSIPSRASWCRNRRRPPSRNCRPIKNRKAPNVAWIPGYWAWDDERNDFLWVSGSGGLCRRVANGFLGIGAKRRKVSQWISGYWADAKASEIEYLPEPPATAEAGPNIAAPSPDQNWMPGSWVWQQGRYLWRPGYWAVGQPDWDWVPAHYVWAPRGYVYVDGYWDYSVGRRGVLFAPVFFDANVYAQQGFSYSPAVVINPAVFASQLFLRPNYQHYYFGDYYGSNYAAAGFYPWFSYNSSRFGYDPIYAQQRWQHRQDPKWARNRSGGFSKPRRSSQRATAAHLGRPAMRR